MKIAMNEQQRKALRELFKNEYDSILHAGIAVSKVIGCVIIPTREIVWFDGKQQIQIARIEEINGKFRWVEGEANW